MVFMEQVIGTTRMSTKGQVIIPKRTREYTDSEDDTIFTVFALDRKTIVLKKLNTKKIVDEFRALREKVKSKVSEGEANEIVHRAR